MKIAISPVLLLCCAGSALAAPVTYNIDPDHTAPAFEADHLGGLSILRGKFTRNSGKIVVDKEAGTGTVHINIDTRSLDFGHTKLEEHAKNADMFDVDKYPQAVYKGKLVGFKDGAPAEVRGTLTLRGVTKPVTLKLNQFMCKPHPRSKKEVCGADASATINRADFGINYGQDFGFKQDVKLLISVEAVRAD
jgi:polyisoprenoid-binding protein YceI